MSQSQGFSLRRRNQSTLRRNSVRAEDKQLVSTESIVPSLHEFRVKFGQRWWQVKLRAGEAPIFILASGWRAGSTLLQRMLLRECFIWGEPYGQARR